MKYSLLNDFIFYLQKLSHYPSSVLLQGPDTFDVQEAYVALKEVFSQKGASFVHPKEGELRRTLLSPSLFTQSKTVVVVDRVDHLKSRDQEFLKQYLSHPHPEMVVVLLSTTLTPTSEIFKLTLSFGVVLSLQDEKPWEKEGRVVEWIISFFRARGQAISSQLALFLAKGYGSDRFSLQNELQKLALYVAAAPAKNKMKPQNGAKDVSPEQGSPGRGNAALGRDELAGTAVYVGEQKEIRMQDIEAILTLEPKSTLWQLSDTFMQKNRTAMLASLKQLEGQDVHSLVILRHLRHVVSQTLQMRSLLDSKIALASIAENFPQLKGKLFEKNLQRARELSPSFLAKALVLIDRAEHSLKDSPFDEEATMMHLLLQASS